MRRVRVRRSEYVFNWLCFLAAVAFGIGLTLWQMKVSKPRQVAAQQVAPVQVAAAEVVPAPAARPAKKKPAPRKVEAQREGTGDRPERGSSPVIDDRDYRPASEVLNPTRREPQLGVEEEAPQPAKGWVEAEDKTYVGKVVPCEGAKDSRSTVMGSTGRMNDFYLCLDIGTAFTKVLADDLYNPVMFSYNGSEHHAVQLRKNDVVRVKVNDGAVLKVEMVKSVKD